MRKVYLIHYAQGVGTFKDDKVQTFEFERDAVTFVGEVATGKREDTKVKSVYEVDLMYGKMHEMEAQLEGFKLMLRHIPKVSQA